MEKDTWVLGRKRQSLLTPLIQNYLPKPLLRDMEILQKEEWTHNSTNAQIALGLEVGHDLYDKRQNGNAGYFAGLPRDMRLAIETIWLYGTEQDRFLLRRDKDDEVLPHLSRAIASLIGQSRWRRVAGATAEIQPMSSVEFARHFGRDDGYTPEEVQNVLEARSISDDFQKVYEFDAMPVNSTWIASIAKGQNAYFKKMALHKLCGKLYSERRTRDVETHEYDASYQIVKRTKRVLVCPHCWAECCAEDPNPATEAPKLRPKFLPSLESAW